MGLMTITDLEMEEWLFGGWDGGFDWNDGNITKLSKHSVSMEEIESIFTSPVIFGGKLVSQEGVKWLEERFILFGETSTEKQMTVVWTRRGKKLRPISCRRMRDEEKRKYNLQK